MGKLSLLHRDFVGVITRMGVERFEVVKKINLLQEPLGFNKEFFFFTS